MAGSIWIARRAGRYIASAATAPSKTDTLERLQKSLALTQRKALTIQLLYAQNWACQSHDEKTYRALLDEVINAGDVLPAQRLENTLAQRKAKRYLGKPRLARCGFGGAP